MGEGIIEATITRWFVEEGSSIEADHPLVEVATDKVDSEIPSPFSGILSRIVYSVCDLSGGISKRYPKMIDAASQICSE